ncbi:hypothetical protein GH714_031689 [Hevea brasiliensis]|uniref:Uncharacterized protein n=1 Tax=Hevea brasiliensis TaxID=3981 RepID=A0A6A6M258_HEVBR|nr:hypothetical protein GH714_031689 [Hevea brasiliensis]
MKETAANAAASAKAGMEKTKATVEEKVEKMSAHDPMQKEMATQKKEQEQREEAEAELNKQEAREHNAAAKQVAKAGGHANYTTGTPGAAYGTEPHAYSHTHSPASGTPGYPWGPSKCRPCLDKAQGSPTVGKWIPWV